MRAAGVAGRKRLALLSGTSENYLWQIASLRREPRVSLAFAIERATREINDESSGLLGVVLAEQLASMRAMEGL